MPSFVSIRVVFSAFSASADLQERLAQERFDQKHALFIQELSNLESQYTLAKRTDIKADIPMKFYTAPSIQSVLGADRRDDDLEKYVILLSAPIVEVPRSVILN